jgi:hypothetical protein
VKHVQVPNVEICNRSVLSGEAERTAVMIKDGSIQPGELYSQRDPWTEILAD